MSQKQQSTPTTTPPQMPPKPPKRWDYIIIGGGTAGATIARILSDKLTDSILLLEMGPNHVNDRDVTDPNGLQAIQSIHTVVQDYVTTADPNIRYEKTIVPRGIGYGGMTASDNMTAVQPSMIYLNKLEEMTEIPSSMMLGYFKAIETFSPQPGTIVNSNRGESGPLTVTQLPPGESFYNLQPTTASINSIFPQLLATSYGINGLPATTDYIGYELFTAPYFELFAKNTKSRWYRQDTGTQLLNPILYPSGMGIPLVTIGDVSQRNIQVYDRAKVIKLYFKRVKTRCTKAGCDCNTKVRPYAVDVLIDNIVCCFSACKGIILCCGPIETPLLLQRSGIGPSSILDTLKICPVIYNDNVGKHLLGHTGSILNAQLSIPTENYLSMVAYTPEPLITTNLPQSLYPLNYMPNRAYQIYGYTPPPGTVGSGELQFEVVEVVPRVEGSVSLSSIDVYSEPEITLPAFATQNQITGILNLFRNISSQLNNYITEYNLVNPIPITINWPFGDPLTMSDGNLFQLASANTVKEDLIGTARMAPFGGGVVNTQFEVYGTCGLYIADASILPIAPDSGIDWVIIAIAQYFANLIIQGNPNKRSLIGKAPEGAYSTERRVMCSSCGCNPCCCPCPIIQQFKPCEIGQECQVASCEIKTPVCTPTPECSSDTTTSNTGRRNKRDKHRGYVEFESSESMLTPLPNKDIKKSKSKRRH